MVSEEGDFLMTLNMLLIVAGLIPEAIANWFIFILFILPSPDTIIRVIMTFKGLENPIDVQEQKLETLNRTGFVAVEWGGTEIN